MDENTIKLLLSGKLNEIRKLFNNKIFNDTLKYQKKYGFKIGQGEHAT